MSFEENDWTFCSNSSSLWEINSNEIQSNAHTDGEWPGSGQDFQLLKASLSCLSQTSTIIYVDYQFPMQTWCRGRELVSGHCRQAYLGLAIWEEISFQDRRQLRHFFPPQTNTHVFVYWEQHIFHCKQTNNSVPYKLVWCNCQAKRLRHVSFNVKVADKMCWKE